jgi:hypothetical protein
LFDSFRDTCTANALLFSVLEDDYQEIFCICVAIRDLALKFHLISQGIVQPSLEFREAQPVFLDNTVTLLLRSPYNCSISPILFFCSFSNWKKMPADLLAPKPTSDLRMPADASFCPDIHSGFLIC